LASFARLPLNFRSLVQQGRPTGARIQRGKSWKRVALSS
jgi:hypothetical protein